MSTIFERNSNQALIGKIEKLAKKYNPIHAKNKDFKLNDIADALKNLGFIMDLRANELNFDKVNLNINAFIDSALATGIAGPGASTTSTTKTTDTNKSKFYQALKDILIDTTLEDLKSIRKFQKISGDELKNLENLEKTLDSFKKNNEGNLDAIMIFRNEISEIVSSLKLNITALQNFDKDEVKLANLLREDSQKITREELANNIKFENERLNGLSRDHKRIQKDLNSKSTKEITDLNDYYWRESASKITGDEKYKRMDDENVKNERTKNKTNNQNTEIILSDAKQFEKAKWNTKGVIGMLVAIFSQIFQLNKTGLKARFTSAKENLAFVKNHDKTMKDIKECLKEYAKLSRQFENLEREYANAGFTDKKRYGIGDDNSNKAKFNILSRSLKELINTISKEYKEIENLEKGIKDKKEEIKTLNKKDPGYKTTLTSAKSELKDLETNLKTAKNDFDEVISEMSSFKASYKLDKDGNKIQDKQGKDVKISAFEALKDQLKFTNKDFEKQNKEFQKLEHRNAGLLQKASDYLFGFDNKGKAKEETKKFSTELNLKENPRIIDGKSAEITLR